MNDTGSHLFAKRGKVISACGFARFSKRFWLCTTKFTVGSFGVFGSTKHSEWVGGRIFLRHSRCARVRLNSPQTGRS